MFARRRLIIEVIYAPLIGGSETLAFTLCKQWKADGIDTRICCLYEKQGALTAQFEAAGIPYDLMDVGELGLFRRWVRLTVYFLRYRPSAIHAHHLGTLITALIPAYLSGCWNVVYTEHSSYLIAETGWMRRAVLIASRFVRKITCVSNKMVEYFNKELRVPARKLVTVYNGVDTETFRPASDDKARGVVTIGAVGRAVEEKDYPLFLRALAILKDRGVAFSACIAGDGPLRSDLERLARELGLGQTLTFLGRRADIPKVLRSLDIYALSSKNEGMPIAILEAMATGLAVVSTAVDAVPEVIVHEANGLLVPVGDAAGFADALERLISNPALRARLGNAALHDVRALFSIQSTKELYAEYLGITP